MDNLKKAATYCVLGIGLSLCSALTASAETAQVRGTVYQVESDNVYVQAADHTAVKVPILNSVFRVHGIVTDVRSLHKGEFVVADYTPEHMKFEPSNVYPQLPEPRYRTIYRAGHYVHQGWDGGAWVDN
jgi:hypothetical protein